MELMVVAPRVLERLESWAKEPRGGVQRLPKELVHKWKEENVFLSRVEQALPDTPDEHVAEIAVDPAHPFFFEHPLDHIPGMMLLEAGRQLATALAHLHYGVPSGRQFLLNDLSVRFLAMAELDLPTFIASRVSDKRYRRGTLAEMQLSGGFVQAGTVIGMMEGKLGIFGGAVTV